MSWKTAGKIGEVVGGPLVGGAFGLLGASKQSSSADKAAELALQGNREALAFEREQAAEDKRRYEEQLAAQRAQWDAYQNQMAAYRAASRGLLDQNVARLGLASYKAPAAPQYIPGMTAPSTNLGQIAGLSPKMSPTELDTSGMTEQPGMMPKLTIQDILNNSWASRRA